MITIERMNRLNDADLERWRNQAKKVECPTCGGPPGMGCAFLPGLAFIMRAYHLERFRAAEKAGLI